MTNPQILGATRPEIRSLTGLRAVAASWVVLEHFRQPLYALIPGAASFAPQIQGGYLGVEVFFVLSGFIIAYNYADRFATFTGRTYGNFLLARFGRIYPVHLVTILIVALLVFGAALVHLDLSAASKYTPLDFVANVVMLQAIPPFEAVNSPAWSIGAEAAAYLAFPLIALYLTRFRTARAPFLAAGLVAILGGVAMWGLVLATDSGPTSAGVIWLRILFEFTCGALLFTGWRYLGRRLSKAWDLVSVVAAVGVLAALQMFPPGSGLSLALLPLIAVFVLGCATSAGPVAGLLSTRVMRWGGRISYSVYMTHFIVLMIVGKLLPWTLFAASPPPERALVMIAYVVIVVAVGAAMYHLVEEPARKQIRRWAAGRLHERTVRPRETT